MMQAAMQAEHDGVTVITLDLATCTEAGTFDAVKQRLDAARNDAATRAIVLSLEPGVAPSRAAAVGGTLPDASLGTLIACIEESRSPVVAALAGTVAGSAAALALACHARVALATARVGFPGVAVGLMPGAGATQRLPRLVGVDVAQALLLQGDLRSASKLSGSGLLDEVVNEDVAAAARRVALRLAGAAAPLPLARDRTVDPSAVARAVEAQRAKLTPRQRLQPVHGALLDAVAGSALPFEQGLELERRLMAQCEASPAARALRYQDSAQEAAVRYVAPAGVAARTVNLVAVIGAGTMGTGIAIAALEAGLSVLLLEQDAGALQRGRQRIDDHYRQRVDAGKVSADRAAALAQRLQVDLDWSGMASADLVIEAVFEDLAVKQEVFRKIDRHARAGAVLASNTSYLDLDLIANATARPAEVVGLHFFSPANVMKLLEVVRGAHTAADVIATAMAVGAALGKVPVQSGNAFGFIGNRIYNAYRKQCEILLEDGAWPEQVDHALTSMGFAMGPFAVADLSGLDIAWRMRKSQAATRDPGERYVDILDQLCEQGRLGRKSGAGYYAYESGRAAPASDATVRAIVTQASARRGIVRRELSADEIRRRALLAMVNEAAAVLAAGIASRPGDIDVVMVQGYGFPRWEGGPVYWARQQDRATLDIELTRMQRETGPGFVRADLSSLLGD